MSAKADTEEAIPPCAASMGCLCAGHARGNPTTAKCDTSEISGVTLVEALDELLAMAQEVGRAMNNVARADHAHTIAPRGQTREPYNKLRIARREATAATERLAHARMRFLARI